MTKKFCLKLLSSNSIRKAENLFVKNVVKDLVYKKLLLSKRPGGGYTIDI